MSGQHQRTSNTSTPVGSKPISDDSAPASRAVSRRAFMATTSVLASGLAAPRIIAASKTNEEIIVGDGEHRFRVDHHWAELPQQYSWQTTHNVAVDAEENLYVIHEGHPEKKDHPSIFVFDRDGKFVRAFGEQFQGGGHGIEVRREGNEQFLYVAAYQQVKSFAKLTLNG